MRGQAFPLGSESHSFGLPTLICSCEPVILFIGSLSSNGFLPSMAHVHSQFLGASRFRRPGFPPPQRRTQTTLRLLDLEWQRSRVASPDREVHVGSQGWNDHSSPRKTDARHNANIIASATAHAYHHRLLPLAPIVAPSLDAVVLPRRCVFSLARLPHSCEREFSWSLRNRSRCLLT